MPESLSPASYALLADAVLALHAAIVLFVVGGLLYVLLGHRRDWPGARSLRLRLAHGLAIGVVVAQAWLGQLCPLTVLEMWLRRQAGQAAYGESFVAHWLGRLLYWDAPGWVFIAAYTLFGLVVLAVWWWLPPERRRA